MWCSLDNDNRLTRYSASSWFETRRTTLDLLGETLSFDEVVSEDETTQTGGSRVIDEVSHSTRRRRRHR
jgi:hypothetical protein